MVNCKNEKCLSFNIDVYRHIFKTGEAHAKALCHECGYRWFINRDYLKDDSPILQSKTFKKTVREIKRQARLKNTLVKKEYKLIDKINPLPKLIKRVETLHKKKNKTKPIKKIKKDFYLSREWRELRYKVIKKFDRKCMVCFRTNIEIHIDHIKPISKFPHLALEITNLQVLCVDCNFGKSNKDSIDWRPE